MYWIPAFFLVVGLLIVVLYRYRVIRQELRDSRADVEALEAAELNYRVTFEHIPSALVLVRPSDGNIVDCNAAFAEMTGWPKEQIIAKGATGLNLWATPAQRHAAAEYLRKYKVVRNVDIDIRAADDSIKRCNGSTAIVHRSGETMVLVSLLDVTSVKESRNVREMLADETSKREAAEYNYQRSFEQVPAALVLIRPENGRFLECNAAFEALLGRPKSQLLGEVGDKIKIWAREEQRVMAVGHLRNLDEVKNVEVDILSEDGSTRHCRYSTTIMQHSGSSVILAALLDLTSVKESEHAEKQLHNQLSHRQALDDIGTLSSGIAHDFNNALSVVMGYSELATLQQDVPTKIREYVNEVNIAGCHAKELIAQLMAFSRPSNSDKKEIDLISAVQEIVRFLKSTLPRKKIVEFESSLDSAVISGNATQLHQLLLNLSTNAIQAMPDGGELHFVLEKQAVEPNFPVFGGQLAEGDYFVLEIRDSGDGIEAELLPRVFEPFFTTKSRSEGTGLGLATVLKTIKSSGGGVQVSSALGEGTTFTLYWPAAAAELSVPATQTGMARGYGQRILIVDDDISIAELYSQILEAAGYKPKTLPSGDEALEVFERGKFDVDMLMTDNDMPGLTGIELARAATRIDSKIPIVIVSGSEINGRETDRDILDLATLLLKPITPSELTSAVAEIFAKEN